MRLCMTLVCSATFFFQLDFFGPQPNVFDASRRALNTTHALTSSTRSQQAAAAMTLAPSEEAVSVAPRHSCESIVDPYGRLADDRSSAGAGEEPRTWLSLPPSELLLRYPDSINVCAPMVRYSKHAFRALVSHYNTQITTTPMILAQEFSRSATAREADFSTSPLERGFYAFRSTAKGKAATQAEYVRGALVCQMAANDSKSFADAAELVAPYVDGVDLNCGCPQPWAYSEGIGSALLRQPDKVRDIVRAVKARLGEGFCMTVKIRVDDDLRLTDQLVRTALHAGASILSIHGRTRHQPSDSHPVNLDAIRFAVDAARACGSQSTAPTSLPAAHERQRLDPATEARFDGGGAGGAVPCVANGDVWSLSEATQWRARTGAEGVMSARGLLANPALFAGYKLTPKEAVHEFSALSTAWGLPYALHQ